MTPHARPLAAYVDTTAVIAIVFGVEPSGPTVQRRLESFPIRLSSNLLEAELRSAFRAEGEDFDLSSISSLNWIFPNRRLDAELATCLAMANLSPNRVWHLATAMFIREVLQRDMAFISLEEQQERVARELGFWIP